MFFSAAFVILFTFGLVALRQWMMNQNLRESLSDWITILLIGGVPLVAAVFGIAAAMGIRKEPERSAEEVLPIPPFTRSAGAYLTSFLLLFAIGVPLLVLGISMNSLLVFGDYGIEQDVVMAVTAVVYFHLLSFVLYYWIKDIFLSVVLAALVMFAHYQLFEFLRHISEWYNYPYHPTNIFNNTFLLNSVVSVFAVLLALLLLAKNIERGIRITLRRGISICLIILSGLAVSAGIAIYASNVVKTALFPDFALWRGSFVDETRLGNWISGHFDHGQQDPIESEWSTVKFCTEVPILISVGIERFPPFSCGMEVLGSSRTQMRIRLTNTLCYSLHQTSRFERFLVLYPKR